MVPFLVRAQNSQIHRIEKKKQGDESSGVGNSCTGFAFWLATRSEVRWWCGWPHNAVYVVFTLVCVCVSTIYMCGGQRTSFRNWFSPSTVGFGDRTQVISLVANTFIC